MEKKRTPQRKRLAALFVSLTIILVGSISLFENMTIDYYSVLDTIKKIIPASIIMGGLGWVMGMVLDRPKKGHSISYNDMFLNEFAHNRSIMDAEDEDEISDAATQESEDDKE